jgi:hypothetical protein
LLPAFGVEIEDEFEFENEDLVAASLLRDPPTPPDMLFSVVR